MSENEPYVPESFKIIEEALEKSMTPYKKELSNRMSVMMVDQAKYGGWPQEKIDIECRKIAMDLIVKFSDRSPNDK